MAERPEDLTLPLSVVSRIINDALPSGTMVSAEAKKVIAKTASVFVLYATTSASQISSANNKKSMSANDVLEAISSEMEFSEFRKPLEKALESYRANLKRKKESTTKKQANTSTSEGIQKKSTSPKEKGTPSNKKKSPSSAKKKKEVKNTEEEDEESNEVVEVSDESS